jgi:alkanesulfonate monooxygenase SsuD/methylene tetrahydromethanopterin reductase-like flavin-dependent oxidoreductase (luciferase family)
MIDTIEICHRMWTDERTTYQGKHYRVENAVCAPKPMQKPYPPLWVGGAGPRVLRIAARLADGFDIARRPKGGGFVSGDEMRAHCDELDAASKAAKRERRLLRSHWSSADVGDEPALRSLRERADAYERAGLDRYLLSFPKERAAEMIPRASAIVRH